jgi:hypothetical protein
MRMAEKRRRSLIAAAGLVVVLLGVAGLAIARTGETTPPLSPALTAVVPHDVPAQDVVASAEKIVRADQATSQFFAEGNAVILEAYPTSIDRSGPETQGIALRLGFPDPFSFTGSFPETEPAKDGSALLGTQLLKATNVSRLLIAVDLRTQKVANVILDPTDLDAKTEVLSSSIPRDQIFTD